MTEHKAHEATLYRAAEGGFCDCFLCSHHCHIKPGGRGFCRVRENRDGTLYSLVYGMVVAANVDPIEKKPLYHFMPGTSSFSIATAGCNFQCDFCQNWQISQGAREEDIPGEFTPPEDVVGAAVDRHCPSISYTYTEPTIYFEYAFDCAKFAQAAGIRNVFVTNGYETADTIDRMAGVIDAANVDLKAFNDDFYRERCKGRLEPVCAAIRQMSKVGIWVEVTTLLIPEFNDDPEELKQLADFLVGVNPDIPWHISRYHPDYQFDRAPITPTETIYRACETGRKAGLRYVYAGNLPGEDYGNTLCPHCNLMVVRRSGFTARPVGLNGKSCKGCGQTLAFIL